MQSKAKNFPKRIIPQVGTIYSNRNGDTYVCDENCPAEGTATMRRASDGWTLVAHGIALYEDGTIEWDYSTGGGWPDGKRQGR